MPGWLIGAGAVLCGWCLLSAAAWRFEHRLLFGLPRRLRPAPSGRAGGQHRSMPVSLHVAPGIETRGVLTVPRAGTDGEATGVRCTLVWFGGRNEDVRWTTGLADWLGPEFAVAAWAYRGHLGAAGRPTERLVVADGLRALRWLRREAGLGQGCVILAGRSLGSAVALQVAARLPRGAEPAGLVLLSPIDSVRALVRAHPLFAAAAWALRSPFDSMAAVEAAARCPTLMLLAADDGRVPHFRSRRLAAAIEKRAPVRVRTVAGTDHRTLPRSTGALEAMAAFAREVVA